MAKLESVNNLLEATSILERAEKKFDTLRELIGPGGTLNILFTETDDMQLEQHDNITGELVNLSLLFEDMGECFKSLKAFIKTELVTNAD